MNVSQGDLHQGRGTVLPHGARESSVRYTWGDTPTNIKRSILLSTATVRAAYICYIDSCSHPEAIVKAVQVLTLRSRSVDPGQATASKPSTFRPLIQRDLSSQWVRECGQRLPNWRHPFRLSDVTVINAGPERSVGYGQDYRQLHIRYTTLIKRHHNWTQQLKEDKWGYVNTIMWSQWTMFFLLWRRRSGQFKNLQGCSTNNYDNSPGYALNIKTAAAKKSVATCLVYDVSENQIFLKWSDKHNR